MRARAAHNSIFGPLAVFALASAIAIPAGAQQTPPASTQNTPPATAQSQQSDQSTSAQPQQQPSPDANQQRLTNKSKEGFWGRVQPFARKKWVKRQTDPINDRLTELDQVNAKNAKDIQDVDARAQAGIHQAQSTADAANQTATQAGAQAQQANATAQGATGKVDQIHTTVNGLDQYHPVNEMDVAFRGSSAVLSKDAQGQLDQLVSSVNGRQGYIIEVEAHAPGHGAVGISNSQRLAQSVDRYLIEHDIPVYRVHAVALGNAPMEANAASTTATNTQASANGEQQENAPVRKSSVHIRLMENSLAAQGAAPPQGAASSTGAERP
jgi:outer membrane protein OmpA-like peptidoglycan-associated protein